MTEGLPRADVFGLSAITSCPNFLPCFPVAFAPPKAIHAFVEFPRMEWRTICDWLELTSRTRN